jgi:hypothetical protein
LELGALPWHLEDGPLPHAVAMVLYERRRQIAMKQKMTGHRGESTWMI